MRRIAIIIVCAGLGMVGGLVVLLATSMRRPPPAMDSAQFEQAQLRWQNQNVADYILEIQLAGRQTGEVKIEVRDGQPIAMTRNGVAALRHTWEHWTVDGLFEIIRKDLEGLDEPARAFGVPRDDKIQPVVTQQAEFDVQLGYPRRYRRAVQDSGDEIEWEIVRFERR